MGSKPKQERIIEGGSTVFLLVCGLPILLNGGFLKSKFQIEGFIKSQIKLLKSFKYQIQISNGFEIQTSDFKWQKSQV